MGRRLLRGGVVSGDVSHSYDDIISVSNLLAAWDEFRRGKRKRSDVLIFQANLMGNILNLHQALKLHTYVHGGYEHFVVIDPKRRDIHKASVRDRLVHHAIYRILYPHFDTRFIYDSYSCRNHKGTHRAIAQFRRFAGKVSENNTRTCYVLKCDVRKFFASIDHKILLAILGRHMQDQNTLGLLRIVIESFQSIEKGTGLPLGNLTSQLLVNIYMNEFDRWAKHYLKVKYYIRYADDFVVLSSSRDELLKILSYMKVFLGEQLMLQLHPNKVSIQTMVAGVDFLGWVHFPHHSVLRTTTKKRVVYRLGAESLTANVRQSYKGLLEKGSTYKLCCQLGLNST